MEIERNSSILIKAAFSFFIYTLPSNILLSLVLYFLYLLLKNYKISHYLRRFYFFKTNLFQTLLEGNVIYFTYVCFGHFQTSFHFHFGDKVSLTFTTVFFGVIVLFTFTFYFLTGRYLGKKSKYFTSFVHRCNSGLFFLTFQNLIRNFLRGSVFFFLYYLYLEQLILLSVV